MVRSFVLVLVAAVALTIVPTGAATARAASPGCDTRWKLVGTDTFRGAAALTRSQGVTSDGHGWLFSWQGGLERTDDAFLTSAVGTWPPQLAVAPETNPSGSTYLGDNHIGDIDTFNGLVYAPLEDGGQSLGPVKFNDPEYQHPHVALYDAHTLAYTGVSYALDKRIHEAGVPWVAINAPLSEVYTAEWEMPHDRINVFDTQMRFRRFLELKYPASFGPGFHLSRVQGAKVLGHTLIATRDDAQKTLFSIDLRTGRVTRLFAIEPGEPAELEGLAIRPTPDGALLHVMIILDNKVDPAHGGGTNIRTAFMHYAPVRRAGCR